MAVDDAQPVSWAKEWCAEHFDDGVGDYGRLVWVT